jgi:hypothetical protein
VTKSSAWPDDHGKEDRRPTHTSSSSQGSRLQTHVIATDGCC